MSRSLIRLFVLIATVAGFAPASVAGPFVGSLQPQSVARGATTRVVVTGTELAGALDLWTSLPAGTLRARPVGAATPDRAVFDVLVAADAPLGLYGVRLASDDGLSNAAIFLVDDLAPKSFPLANPTPTEPIPPAHPVTLPVALAGTFRPARFDRFAFDATAGQTVAFEVVASRFGKDSDPLLRIRDPQGRVVVERDNDPGLFFDLRGQHTFADPGRYVVEVGDARHHGHAEWSYVLRLGRFPAARVAIPSALPIGGSTSLRFPELPQATVEVQTPADRTAGRFWQTVRRPNDEAGTWLAATAWSGAVVVESEPNNAPEQGTPAAAPAMLCGVLEQPGDVDWFVLDLKKGDKVEVRGESAVLDSAADLELAYLNADGKEAQRVDDVLQDEASLTMTASKDGPHRLLVRDVTGGGGPGFAYRLEVRPVGPRLTVAADFSDLTLPQGAWQSFPVSVARTGFDTDVRLELVDAPRGLVLEPDVVPAGKTTLACRVRAEGDAPLGVHTLRLTGTATAGETPLEAFARTQPMIDRQLHNVDLIPYGLRENQRRLPPSLTDRVAVQIVPPVPFTVDLPQPTVTLVRFLSIGFPIETARTDAFAAPITFKALGGQIGEESEIRRQIFVRFDPATVDRPQGRGTFFSRNLPRESKDRIDLFATGAVRGGTAGEERRITLVRSFELELKAGFDLTCDPPSVALLPGESATFRLKVLRLPPFDGPIEIEAVPQPGLEVPTTLAIPAGTDGTDVTVKATPDAQPRKVKLRFQGQAFVGTFLEDGRLKDLDVEIRKPMPPAPAPKK